jgi:hypothetical protein
MVRLFLELQFEMESPNQFAVEFYIVVILLIEDPQIVMNFVPKPKKKEEGKLKVNDQKFFLLR